LRSLPPSATAASRWWTASAGWSSPSGSELFQIDHGKIDQVEAVLQSVPYGMRSAVWDLP
jgi:hypothetical protein